MKYEKEIEGFKIRIISDKKSFPNNGSEIIVNDKHLKEWIERNYIDFQNGQRSIKTSVIKSELNSIINVIFLAIKDIETNIDDTLAANHIADYFFGQFIPVWETYKSYSLVLSEIDLWKGLFLSVNNWEDTNNLKIKKGTAYFLHAKNYLDINHIDMAFNFIHLAIEDDKFHGLKENPNYNYHKSPAFLFASLNIDNRDNYLYNRVVRIVFFIKIYIKSYNTKFKENFSFDEFKNKFLSKYSKYEDEILYFVYLFILLNQWVNYTIPLDIYNNNFAKMRNLNTIFSSCLFLDKLLSIKTGASSLRGNTKEIITSLYKKLNKKEFHNLCVNLNINRGNPMNPLDKINFILNYNNLLYPNDPNFNPKINKQLLNSMLIYFLRNEGAHNLKLEDLSTSKYRDIIESLIFQLFIIVSECL